MYVCPVETRAMRLDGDQRHRKVARWNANARRKWAEQNGLERLEEVLWDIELWTGAIELKTCTVLVCCTVMRRNRQEENETGTQQPERCPERRAEWK